MDLNDPAIFNCPFIMMTEVGAAYIGPAEARHLREYLLKGGFLWADDFWGSYAVGSLGRRAVEGAAAGRVPDQGPAARTIRCSTPSSRSRA